MFFFTDTDKVFKTFIVDNSMDGDQSNFTFHFDSGVSVNVFCQEQILHVVLVAPPIHFVSQSIIEKMTCSLICCIIV